MRALSQAKQSQPVAVVIVPAEDLRHTLLVLGEREWPEENDVVCIDFGDLDKTGLRLTPELELQVHDNVGNWTPVSGIAWRGQFDRHASSQRAAFSLVCASGLPCLNSQACILRASDRVSLAVRMQNGGLPTVPAHYFLGSSGIGYFHTPTLPCVLKFGNWHMGYGKIKAPTQEAWSDAADLPFIVHGSVAVEPFLDYRRDLRVLILGETVLAFERIPSQWRANVCPAEGRFVEVPDDLFQMSQLARSIVDAEVIGVDWVQLKSGKWVLLEANLAPGLQFEGLDLRPHVTSLLRERVGGTL